MISRFAPSPTGLLHLGHAWSAVLAHALARRAGGKFVVRIEDIDTGRCRPEFADAIQQDLAWLGLAHDGPVLVQSTRKAAHQMALDQLTAMRLTYPCFCTRADIAAATSAPHGLAAKYPGTCSTIDRDLASARTATESHAIRLDVAAASAVAVSLQWIDSHAGRLVAAPELLGDIVLARRDIGVGYMLAAVVDDAHQGVTDIVRGRDLFEATHVQRLLQALLGLRTPRYHHHALLLAADGRRLAKRDGAETLASLRAAGVDGAALAERLRRENPVGPDRVLQ